MSGNAWVVSAPMSEIKRVTMDQVRERYGLSADEVALVEGNSELLLYAQASTLTTSSSAQLIEQLKQTTQLLETLVHKSTGD